MDVSFSIKTTRPMIVAWLKFSGDGRQVNVDPQRVALKIVPGRPEESETEVQIPLLT